MKRKHMIGVALATVGLALILITNRHGQGPRFAENAQAAELGKKKDTASVWEYGPERAKLQGPLFLSVSVYAFRELRSGDPAAIYGVFVGESAILSVESAENLVAFYDRHTASMKSKKEIITKAIVEWEGTVRDGRRILLTRDLSESHFTYILHQAEFKANDKFIAGMKAALGDIEAMKAIPFSAKP